MLPDFASALQKTQRADEHIKNLDRLIRKFTRLEYGPVHIQHDFQTGENFMKHRLFGELPEEVPLVLGDAIHNLHSALDHAAFQIVTTYRPTVPEKQMDKIKFPVRREREDLVAAIKGRQVHMAIDECASLATVIIDEIKPYKGGNDPIYALHQFDIEDKHRLLIPVFAATEMEIPLPSGGPSAKNPTEPLPDELRGKVKTAESVLFDKGVFKGQTVIPTLIKLADAVSGVLDALAKACPPRRVP